MTSKQRRCDAWRSIDVDTTLFKGFVPVETIQSALTNLTKQYYLLSEQLLQACLYCPLLLLEKNVEYSVNLLKMKKVEEKSGNFEKVAKKLIINRLLNSIFSLNCKHFIFRNITFLIFMVLRYDKLSKHKYSYKIFE